VKKLLTFAVIAVLAFFYLSDHWPEVSDFGTGTQSEDSVIRDAFENGLGDIQVKGEGRVIKVLKDDLDGSRHQRFILRLDSGQTVLVAHNIDLAPRVAGLKQGDTVEFFGEYEWNNKGGVIHWTHHDPAGRHVGGWLKHGGKTYQ